jgi:hypothetical protein
MMLRKWRWQMANAKLMAWLGLDGSNFHKSLKESRTEVRSFEKDVKFLASGMGAAFAIQGIQKFAAAFKELKAYEKENGIQLLSPDVESHFEQVTEIMESWKMSATAFSLTLMDGVTKAVQAMSAGFATGFDPQAMANAIDAQYTAADERNLKKSLDRVKKAEESRKISGQSKDERLSDLKAETDEMRKQGEAQKAGLDAAIKRGISEKLQAEWIDKLNNSYADYLEKMKEVDKLQKEIGGMDFPKEVMEHVKARDDAQKDFMKEAAENNKSEMERVWNAQQEDIRKRVAKKEEEFAYKHAGEVGFQPQRMGGMYAGIAGNAATKTDTLLEQILKATERGNQVAERQKEHAEIEAIRHPGAVAR